MKLLLNFKQYGT